MIFRAHLTTSFLLMSSRPQVSRKAPKIRPRRRPITIHNYFFNDAESDDINDATAGYFMFIALKKQCKNLNSSLDFDKKNRKVVLHLEKNISDRAKYEALKTYAQTFVQDVRVNQTGQFPTIPQNPRIEWVYPDVLGSSLPQEEPPNEEEEEEEESKDDDKKDPDWKP